MKIVATMKEKVTISIGEYYATSEQAVIYTLLGSCVAVCLFDPTNQIGGMNHILMPGRPDMKKYAASARYGVHAMELLINGIMTLGGNRKKLIAKTFGGASIIPAISKDKAIGKKIVEFVVDFLHAEKIRIVSQDFGGHVTRKVYFHTDTGDVFMKRIASSNYSAIIQEEQKRLQRIEQQLQMVGDVTLFDP